MKLYEMVDTDKQQIQQIKSIIEKSGLTNSIYNCVKRICNLFNIQDVEKYSINFINGGYILKYKCKFIKYNKNKISQLIENSIVSDSSVQTSYSKAVADFGSKQTTLHTDYIKVSYRGDINLYPGPHDTTNSIITIYIDFPSMRNHEPVDNSIPQYKKMYGDHSSRHIQDTREMSGLFLQSNLAEQIKDTLNSVLQRNNIPLIDNIGSRSYKSGRYRVAFFYDNISNMSDDEFYEITKLLKDNLKQDSNIRTSIQDILKQSSENTYTDFTILITGSGKLYGGKGLIVMINLV